MNITFLSHRLSNQGGGVQSSMIGLSRALNSLTHHTAVVGVNDRQLDDTLGSWRGTRVYASPVSGPMAFGYAPDMRQSLANASSDIIHQHGIWTYASIAGRQVATAQATPRVITPHNMLDSVSLSISSLRKKIALSLYERLNINQSQCIHALVDKEAVDIRQQGYKPPICVVPNGVSVPPTHGLPPHLHQLINGQPYLLYLSRLTEVKQVLVLIDAWQSCKDHPITRHWKLVIAGWGTEEMQRRVAAAVERAALKNLHFVGPVFGQDKDELFAHADVFALPSISEGLPMAVLESLAHGTPVLITKECNLHDVEPAGAGIVVKTDFQSIRDGVQSLIERSETERKLMRENARALANRSYTWMAVAAKLSSVYQWLLGGGPRPDNIDWH